MISKLASKLLPCSYFFFITVCEASQEQMFGNYYFISCVKVACVNAFWAKNFSVKKVSSVKRFVTKQKNCHNSRNTLGDRGWNRPPSLRYILFYDFSVTHLNFMNLVNFLEIFLGLIFLTFFSKSELVFAVSANSRPVVIFVFMLFVGIHF